MLLLMKNDVTMSGAPLRRFIYAHDDDAPCYEAVYVERRCDMSDASSRVDEHIITTVLLCARCCYAPDVIYYCCCCRHAASSAAADLLAAAMFACLRHAFIDVTLLDIAYRRAHAAVIRAYVARRALRYARAQVDAELHARYARRYADASALSLLMPPLLRCRRRCHAADYYDFRDVCLLHCHCFSPFALMLFRFA